MKAIMEQCNSEDAPSISGQREQPNQDILRPTYRCPYDPLKTYQPLRHCKKGAT